MIKQRDEWLKVQAERNRIPVERLEKAFAAELDKPAGIADPLEVPDRMEIEYRYSYGGISRFFRELRDNRLIFGSHCPSCEKTFFPPRTNCPDCYAETTWKELGTNGTVLAFSTVHVATSDFHDRTPFVCALIKLDGCDTSFLQNVFMKDVSAARVGMRVKACFREIPLGDFGDLWFDPA